ncbi:hypothetical protein [Pasteurella oralis]|uniref:hypothetical protein n=1 Tax=Pasteurella oralis TaxID=1071947 RepID=UPI001FE72266|nr:hypothetical protein [Pasteurella oralis]
MKIKSLILITSSLIPAITVAQTSQTNFYVKAGIDLTSRFETLKIHSGFDESYHHFARGSKKNTFSPSIFLETTYNILPQTEVGLGVGYIKRKGFNYYHEYNLFKEEYKINRYSSIPIYSTFKQNFSLN